MGHFKKGGRGFGGGEREGGFRSGGFQKKSWGGRDNDREVSLHHARCSNCHKDCEVPFKPTNGKPVFCKECFAANKDGGENFSRGPKRDFGRSERPRRDFDRRHDAPRPSFSGEKVSGNDDLKKQIEKLEIKVDRLIQSVENLNRVKPMLPKNIEEVKKTSEDKGVEIKKALKADKTVKEVKKSNKKKPIKK